MINWDEEIDALRKDSQARWDKHKELLDSYHMRFDEVPGIGKDVIVKMSRMYPLVRQIISTITFHYPRVFVQASPGLTGMNIDLTPITKVYTRSANEALRLMKAKPEVQQSTFDALFHGVGWLKQGFNPLGTDSIAPYVMSDSFRDGFPYVMRRDPRNVWVDKLCEPQSIGYARFVIERMLVPMKFMQEDTRYNNEALEELAQSRESYDFTESILLTSEESNQALKDAMQRGDVVEVYEIHDRIERKIITKAVGQEQLLREDDHPMAGGVSEVLIDDQGVERVGKFTVDPGKSMLVEDGFQHIPLRFDLTDEGFVPTPSMEYVKDLEKLIIESVSRRADLLQRFKRIIFAEKGEMGSNANIAKQFKESEDGDVVEVNSLSGIREADWGSVPADQLGLESDARQYEAETLHVGEMSVGSSSRKTATQSSLEASAGGLNREWMEQQISEVWVKITNNNFRMWRDRRYYPREFIINTAVGDAEQDFKLLTAENFLHEFKVSVEAGSMRPMTQELEQENAILLYDRLQGNEMVDQEANLRMLISAFKKINVEELLVQGGSGDTNQLVMMENVMFLMQGQQPQTQPGMKHKEHIEGHYAIVEMPQFQQMHPEQQQLVLQTVEEHVAGHEQLMQQQATMSGGGSQPSVDGRLTQSSVMSQVRSNAQQTQQAAADQTGTLSRRG